MLEIRYLKSGFLQSSKSKKAPKLFARKQTFFCSPDGGRLTRLERTFTKDDRLSFSLHLGVYLLLNGGPLLSLVVDERIPVNNESSTFAINRPTFHKCGKTFSPSIGEEDITKLS